MDALGILLFAAAALWAMFSATVTGGEPDGTLAVLLGVGSALAIGRAIGGISRSLIAWIVALSIVVVIVPSLPEVISGRPQSGPLGYANANGGLLLQAAIGFLMAGTAGRSAALFWIVAAVAMAIGGIIVVSGSYAAASLLLLPMAVACARRLSRWMTMRVVEACAVLVLVAAASTTLLAAIGGDIGSGASDGSPASSVVGERRMSLWRAAFELMMEHPITGVGPARFDEAAAPASADPDARWAHNEFLQQGAETGVLGGLLLIGLFMYGFARLWAVAGASGPTALAATSLAVLGVHACFDYVLHFPAVPITAALLVGAASGSSHRSRRETSGRTRPTREARPAVRSGPPNSGGGL